MFRCLLSTSQTVSHDACINKTGSGNMSKKIFSDFNANITRSCQRGAAISSSAGRKYSDCERPTVDRLLRRNQILMVLPTRHAADCVVGASSLGGFVLSKWRVRRVSEARTTHLLKTSAIDKSQCCVFCSSK